MTPKAPRMRDVVHFHHNGIRHTGTVMDIRPHLNDARVRFAFVAVLGCPRTFPVPFQRQADDSWKMAELKVFTDNVEVLNVF